MKINALCERSDDAILSYEIFDFAMSSDSDDENNNICEPEPCGPDYGVDCMPDCEPEENGYWLCSPVEDS